MTDEKNKRSDLTCLFLLVGTFALLGIGLLVAFFSLALSATP